VVVVCCKQLLAMPPSSRRALTPQTRSGFTTSKSVLDEELFFSLYAKSIKK